MLISSAEFETNFNRYLDMVAREDIIIHKNGKKIAKLTKDEDSKLADIRSLFGILATTELSKCSDEEIRTIITEEREKRYDSAS